MNILVGEATYREFGPAVHERFPDTRFVLLTDDQRLVTPDGASSDADFEIAWGSQGIFGSNGEPASFLGRMERSAALKWFQSPGAGNDQPIISTLLDRGVTITGTHVHSISIAESVIRGVLDRFQDAAAWRRAQQRGEWSPHWFREAYGTRWMIIGVGAIGADVAVRARAFGVHVIGVRRTPTGDEPVDELITPDAIADRLGECDVVVLTASGNPTTRNLVDRAFLARMKPDAVLVNPSRGSLVDEDALIEALDNGVIGAAILDSFATQPLPPEHPFWRHPRIDVTPHTTARGSGRAARSAELFMRNLAHHVAGEPMIGVVTR